MFLHNLDKKLPTNIQNFEILNNQNKEVNSDKEKKLDKNRKKWTEEEDIKILIGFFCFQNSWQNIGLYVIKERNAKMIKERIDRLFNNKCTETLNKRIDETLKIIISKDLLPKKNIKIYNKNYFCFVESLLKNLYLKNISCEWLVKSLNTLRENMLSLPKR